MPHFSLCVHPLCNACAEDLQIFRRVLYGLVVPGVEDFERILAPPVEDLPKPLQLTALPEGTSPFAKI